MQQQIGQQGSLVAVFLGDALQLLAQPFGVDQAAVDQRDAVAEEIVVCPPASG